MNAIFVTNELKRCNYVTIYFNSKHTVQPATYVQWKWRK